MEMKFNGESYGPEVGKILTSASTMNCLVAAASPSFQLPSGLFAQSAHPQAALSGLWLYLDCFDESHKVAQEDESREGSLWHAISHRREPDYGNASYWFRQVGNHPVYPAVVEAVRQVPGGRLPLTDKWDPHAFVALCEEAEHEGGAIETYALAVQRVEWEIVFDYCARKRSS
jgi:hypothetical protein